jgi:YVTN family beta-propeller protein
MKIFLALAALAAIALASPNYHVARKLAVGGDGGWDYLTVDTVNHRLYISRGTHTMVISTDSEKVIGDIPNTLGVHGIAIAYDLNRGYTSNGRDSSVTIFDLKTMAVIANVKVGARNPDAILYEPVNKRVFTFNGGSSNATALDAMTGAVVGTVPLTGKPEFAQHDGKGTVFVNIENKDGAIIAFDAKTLAPKAPWMMAGCEEPSGLAIDRANGVLFSTCGNKVMAIVDDKTGTLITTVPIGEGVDAGAFDPGTQLAFASNGEGTLTVVKSTGPRAYAVAATVPTQARARTMALDERTLRIYTVTAEFGAAPAPTADNPRPRPPMVPGSFVVLVLEP